MALDDATAAELMALAERVRDMPLASSRDPERPHLERDAIAAAIRQAVYAGRRRVAPVDRGTIAPGSLVVVGRTISVERRRFR